MYKMKIDNDYKNPCIGKYIVWIGDSNGVTISITKNHKDAKRDADEWKAKGYDDVIIERIEEFK
tara:strand:- start:166 stop:357 length:192 start_codon:yes stop_codon:yes gene_type:complete